MAAQNQAIKIIAPGDAQIVDVPIPKLPADDYIIVKTTAVAVNPTDWKHVFLADKIPCIGIWVGCDYAGVVEEVGPGVTKALAKGDRVCGPVNGSNGLRETDGSFANYIAVKGDLQIKTPDNLSDQDAATLGIAVSAAGQALYQTLKIPLPNNPAPKPFPILINGGSTAMAITGIQYAKLSGLTVIATSSPRNFDYLRSLGADAVFDYRSPTIVEDIRAFTNNSLAHVWDCQSDEASMLLCARCFGPDGGKLSTLLPGDATQLAAVNDKVEAQLNLFFSIFGEDFTFMGTQPAVPENYEFAKTFWELSRSLLAEGKLKPIRVYLNRGGEGLKGVLEGMREMREGKVSAGKLVYTL